MRTAIFVGLTQLADTLSSWTGYESLSARIFVVFVTLFVMFLDIAAFVKDQDGKV